MLYTVQQLASVAGVSVRTLHYYDEIGLLKPSFIKENGYRYYGAKELVRLQQILFFKELDFPLEEIVRLIDSKDFRAIEVLKDQKKLLGLKKDRIEKLISTIELTIKKMKGGETMNTDDLFASFDDKELVENMSEAKKRWGDSDAYRQSMKRVRNWTKKDYEEFKKKGNEFTQKLAEAMDEEIKSDKVQALIKQHHKGIEYFYKCPMEMYRNLGRMYVEDKRFTAYYDKFRPGLAKFVCDAIAYYCDTHKE
jgi:DNA-binding transcriptional MerR regulator